MDLFTIGHSNHSLDHFIALLDDNGIMTLVDVRSAPVSRYYPHFNKENLERVLPQHEIGYAFAGQYLGGRPSDPACYKSGQLPSQETDYLNVVDYQEVMRREWFIRGMERLVEMAYEQTTVIMCSEENPAHCHRHHLIAKYLVAEYPEFTVKHIRGDGSQINARTVLTSVDRPSAEQLSLF